MHIFNTSNIFFLNLLQLTGFLPHCRSYFHSSCTSGIIEFQLLTFYYVKWWIFLFWKIFLNYILDEVKFLNVRILLRIAGLSDFPMSYELCGFSILCELLVVLQFFLMVLLWSLGDSFPCIPWSSFSWEPVGDLQRSPELSLDLALSYSGIQYSKPYSLLILSSILILDS